MKRSLSIGRIIAYLERLFASGTLALDTQTKDVFNGSSAVVKPKNPFKKSKKDKMKNQDPKPLSYRKADPIELDQLTEEDKKVIQSFFNFLRAEYSRYLKPGISLTLTAVPYEQGVILEFAYTVDAPNFDSIDIQIRQDIEKAFQSFNLDIYEFIPPADKLNFEKEVKANNLPFSGTSFIGTDDKIYIIKDYSNNLWDRSAAKKDVARILEYAHK